MRDYLLTKIVKEVFDFRPAAIIEKLDLLKPIYENLTFYGHFGREDLNVSWEKLDCVNILQEKFTKTQKKKNRKFTITGISGSCSVIIACLRKHGHATCFG